MRRSSTRGLPRGWFAAGTCAAPAPGDAASSDATPTVTPDTTQCANIAAGLTEDDWVRFRLVNNAVSDAAVFWVSTAAEGCAATWWGTTLTAGENVSGASWPGSLWLFSDGASSSAFSEFVQTDQPVLWVIQ